MDIFMDKLARKFNAQEMIEANKAADAQELCRLQKQLKEYEKCLNEMSLLKQELKECTDALCKELKHSCEDTEKELKNCVDGWSRELQEKIDAIELNQQGMFQLQHLIEDTTSKSNDHVHKESVKVYRNVQAVILDESAKQTAILKQLVEGVEELKKKAEEKKPESGLVKGIMWVSVLSAVLSLGALVFQILVYLHII